MRGAGVRQVRTRKRLGKELLLSRGRGNKRKQKVRCPGVSVLVVCMCRTGTVGHTPVAFEHET